MSQKNNSKRLISSFDFIALSLIFILGLFLRLVYLHQYQKSPFFDSPVIDALSHYIYAQKLAAGDWLLKGLVAPRVPLYVYFLAGLIKWLGKEFYALKVVHMFLGAINCQLVYVLGKKLFGRKVGFFSGIICALYGVLIYFDAEFLSVGLTIFLNINLLFILFSTIEKPKPWKWLISGIFFGICLQTSPNIILFLPLFCAWLYYSYIQQRSAVCASPGAVNVLGIDPISPAEETVKEIKQADDLKPAAPKTSFRLNAGFKPIVFLCIGAFLSVLPFSLRNLFEGGEFVLLSSTVGINLYIGNNLEADGKTAAPPSRDFAYQGWEDNVWVSSIKVAQERTGKKLNNSQVSNYWMFKTAEYVLWHPLHFIGLTLRKIFYLFNAYEIPENQSIYFFRLWSTLLSILVFTNPWISFPFGIIAPLALLGVFLSWNKNNPKLMVLNYFILAHLLLMVIFFVVSRYRTVIIPYFVIYAVYAGARLIDNLKQRQFKLFFKYSLAVLLLLIYCNLHLFGAAQEDKAKWFFNLGTAYSYKGQTARAAKSFEEAYKINPDNLDILYNLGVLHLENGQLDQAIETFEQVVAKDPRDTASYNNIGAALFKQKNFSQAIKYYLKVLEFDPEDAGAMVNLGTAYAALEKYDQALTAFEKAIKTDTAFAPAYNHRAAVYETRGQMDLAEKDYLKAIGLNPRYSEAYYNLASLYKSQGKMTEYKTMRLKSLELMSFEKKN